jgi:hypothetical protein
VFLRIAASHSITYKTRKGHDFSFLTRHKNESVDGTYFMALFDVYFLIKLACKRNYLHNNLIGVSEVLNCLKFDAVQP